MSKILKAIYGSDKTPLKLGEVEVPCYVLEDGTRVLSGRGIQRILGTSATTGKWLEKFVNKKTMLPFLETGVLDKLNNPIAFSRPDAGGSQSITYGYEATLLIDVIDAIIDADRTGVEIEKIVVDSAHILSKALKKISIISLIDEATGYQHEREKDALQKLLKAYVAEELRAWVKTFPDVYYKEIFRLNGWNYTINDIKLRPSVVGKWTNNIIYKQLPKGVLEELKKKTPKSTAGNYTARFFQGLTGDIGNPHLQQQINSVITLMQVSDDWKDFINKFNKLVDRRSGQLELEFKDLEYKPEKKQIQANTEQLSEFNTKLKTALDYNPKENIEK